MIHIYMYIYNLVFFNVHKHDPTCSIKKAVYQLSYHLIIHHIWSQIGTKKHVSFSTEDTTKALTTSPGRKEECISTLSISVALTSCCLSCVQKLVINMLALITIIPRRGTSHSLRFKKIKKSKFKIKATIAKWKVINCIFRHHAIIWLSQLEMFENISI